MRQIKYSSILLFLFLLFTFTLTTRAKDEWIRIQSKNFNLIGNAGEKEVRKVATKLEQFRETFRLLFKTANFDSRIPTNVLVFKSAAAYRPFKPKRADGKIDDFIAGYFMPGKDMNYITLSTEGEDADIFGTIFHEYVHFLVEMNFGKSDIPAWFNEGLAEYYQTFAIEKDQEVKLGFFQQGHINLLSQNKLMPLETLFNISNYQLHQQGSHSRSIFYAQSWVLLHFLLQHPKTEVRQGYAKFINELVKDVPPQKAFEEAFQMNYAQMEKELQKYVEQNTYKYQILTLKQKLTFDSELKVSTLSEAETNAYLGDLLARTRRNDDALPFLQKALALDPNSSMANTSMGTLLMRQRKFAEAKIYLEKAIANDSKNHLAFYNYAYLLSREAHDEFGYVSSFPREKVIKMREALNKAIAINPAYSESYELYGFISLVMGEELEQTFTLLKGSLKFNPGDQEIILRLAEILARLDKFDDAKYLAEKISKSTTDSIIKSRADNILQNTQTMQDFKTRNEALKKQYEEEKKRYEAEMNQRRNNGGNGGENRPLVNRREAEKTPEEIAKLEAASLNFSIMQALKKPTADEQQIIGRITKITCVPKSIVYSIKTETGTLSLFSKDFQSLTLVGFGEGWDKAQVECNGNLSAFKTVLTFNTKSAKSPHSGELVAIDFVPESFRFVEENLQKEILRNEGSGPPSGTTRTAPPPPADSDKTVVNMPENSSPEDFEKKRREMMFERIRKALREPQAGELREIGLLEKVECDSKGQYFVFKTETQLLKLKVNQGLRIAAFVPDAGGVMFECGMGKFNVNAVITFKPNSDKKSKIHGDLAALEFVPATFKLE